MRDQSRKDWKSVGEGFSHLSHFSAHAERQTKAAMGKDKAKKAGQASAAGARAGGFGGGGSFGGCAP
jgi:hypothetical protein